MNATTSDMSVQAAFQGVRPPAMPLPFAHAKVFKPMMYLRKVMRGYWVTTALYSREQIQARDQHWLGELATERERCAAQLEAQGFADAAALLRIKD